MKKLTLSLFFAVSAIALFAQKGLHIGIIGGPQFAAQINKEDSDDADVRYDGLTLRAAFGPTVNYHFNDKVGVGTQFLFSYQGLKYIDRANTDYFRKVTYMKIPLLLHVNSAADKVVGGYFYVGPQFGFLINASLDDNPITRGTGIDNIYKDLHKGVTIGAVMGFGMLFNINDGKFQPHVGLRLDGDITSAFDDEAVSKLPPLFPVDASGNRGATRNVSGLIEVGFKVVLFN